MTLRTRINRLNRDLAALTRNRYFACLPIYEMRLAVEKHGFNSSDLDGIYCGSTGRSVASLGENVWLALTWHKMESGRWEIVAYASKGMA